MWAGLGAVWAGPGGKEGHSATPHDMSSPGVEAATPHDMSSPGVEAATPHDMSSPGVEAATPHDMSSPGVEAAIPHDMAPGVEAAIPQDMGPGVETAFRHARLRAEVGGVCECVCGGGGSDCNRARRPVISQYATM